MSVKADAKIDWLAFPWHRLYPVIDKPEVDLRTFNGEVSYTDGNYLGNFKANLDGPAGAFSLASPFSGDLSNLYLPQLELVAGQGKAQGHVKVQFADGVAWDTALDLSAIDPAYWVAELPGNLGGPLRSTGSFKDERLELNANLDLKGRLRGLPAVLQAKAQGAGEDWNLSALDIRLGDNRINGTARVQQQLKAQLDLNLPGYSQLRERLMPSSERLGVNDCAPEQLHNVQAGHSALQTDGALIVAIELDDQHPWPPKLPPTVKDAGILDSRESRQTLLEQMTRFPPARLAIACDPRRSPDRGSLALIGELARSAAATRVWLLQAPPGQALDADRLSDWHAALEQLGLPFAASAPLNWLETGHD